MLLQKIELKGFLSHFGQKKGTEIVPVEIDFRKSPLWLIYGPNGAGKSAVFDAITFALFKEHRGGKTNFDRLINDKSDSAEVNLEIELGGKQYLIQRTISRKARTKVWGMVRQWDGQEWKAEPETTNAVEDWVTKNLRMSYQTFISAVVLRQGESDAFLKAKPTERKDCLIELLDLEFYRKLGETANTHKNSWKTKQDEYQKVLDKLSEVTEIEIKIQNELILQLEDQLFKSRSISDEKKFALSESKRAFDLTKQIQDKQSQYQLDSQIILDANKIQTQIDYYHQAKIFLLQLETLWQTRNNLRKEQILFNSLLIELETTQKKITQILENLTESKDVFNKVQEQFIEIEIEINSATSYEQNLLNKQKDLFQITKLEQAISVEEAKLIPYQKILDREIEITEKFNLYNQLLLLSPILEQAKNIETIINNCTNTINIVTTQLLEQELQKLTANSNYINTTTQYNQLIEQINCQQLLLTKHIGEINIVKSKIIDENLLENDITCPICGTYLTNDVIKEHLHSKRQYWEQILNSLLSEQIVIENSLNKFLEEKIILEKLQSKLLQENITIDNKILECTTIKNIHKQFLTDQNILLLDLKDKINHVDSNNLANKLKELEIVLSEWQELSEAKQINANISTTILTFQTQLSLLPFLSNEIRQNLLIEIEKVKQEVLQLKNKRSILEKDLSHIKITITKYENEYNNLQNQLTLISYKYSQAQKNIENITTDISKQETNLPTNFKHHKSIVDEIEFIAFKEEIQVLSDIEHKYKELTTAQTRIHQFVGAITLLEEQLEKIILEYRRPIEEVEKEYYKVADEELNIQNQLDQAKRKLIELENQRKAYLETKTFRDKAEKEVIYFTKLANTFGKKGLQAKIIQAAQEKIKQHANTTLRRLSNGIWQVDLQENSQGTELEILARDLSQPKSPLRSFEYLSGGEKFRVAISLAIAIGQSISGGRTVDTLVIDEGFGALDEVNRALLVNELRRLSEEILHGGRIIIVSHQEDVCWEFANRYHIYKGLDGLIEVEHNWNR